MDLIADILLAAGALAAALYCFVLGRRLRRFNDLEKGVGGAVAVLSAQVDDLTRTLDAARASAGASADELGALTERAEDVARRLELTLASMHDLPEARPGSGDGADEHGAGAESGGARTDAPVFSRRDRAATRDAGGRA